VPPWLVSVAYRCGPARPAGPNSAPDNFFNGLVMVSSFAHPILDKRKQPVEPFYKIRFLESSDNKSETHLSHTNPAAIQSAGSCFTLCRIQYKTFYFKNP
jgi:hypothetical protein